MDGRRFLKRGGQADRAQMRRDPRRVGREGMPSWKAGVIPPAGEQVKEGQKMMRIPDLRKMQVNTKVHEALVAKIRGDDRRSSLGATAGPARI